MRRGAWIGAAFALLALTAGAFAQSESFTNFILGAPAGSPATSDPIPCIENSQTRQCTPATILNLLLLQPNTWSAVQSFNSGDLALKGATSGSTVLNATSTATGTLTLPAATDTLVGRATTDTLSNKTLDTASGNTIKLNGNSLTSTPGSATVIVPSASDTLVARNTTDTLVNKTIDTAAPNTIKINGTSLTSTATTVAGQPCALGAACSLATTNLSDVSAGSWTPTDNSGAGLTFTGVSAAYTKIGNMVYAYAQFTYPSTANANNASLAGLPVAVPNQTYAQATCPIYTNAAGASGSKAVTIKGTSTLSIFGPAGAAMANSSLSTSEVNVICIYPAS